MAINATGIQTMKVIVDAKYIDDCTTVTKVKGTKEYTLHKKMKIYGDNKREIQCDDNCVFLVDNIGNINIIPDNTELVIHVNPLDLMDDISYAYEEDK